MRKAQYHPFVLRIPLKLREQIVKAAGKNRRSMQGEILYQLEQGLGEAAGENFGRCAPAARINETALAGGASITQGNGDALDDYPQR